MIVYSDTFGDEQLTSPYHQPPAVELQGVILVSENTQIWTLYRDSSLFRHV